MRRVVAAVFGKAGEPCCEGFRFNVIAHAMLGQWFEVGPRDRPLANIKNQLEVYHWEYLYQLDGDSSQTVHISSPVKWVMTYAGSYTLSDLLEQRMHGEKLDAADLKEHMLRSLTLWLLIKQSPEIVRLLGDLRFAVTLENAAVSGALPYVALTSDVPAFRPQDDLIRTVTKLSGKQVFDELIDVDASAGVTGVGRDDENEGSVGWAPPTVFPVFMRLCWWAKPTLLKTCRNDDV